MKYVMSDIHGNMERFISIMKQINLQEADQLYVLGDVIDRCPDGIKILRILMKMPNVYMIKGNHEHMMLNAFDCLSAEKDATPDIMTQRTFSLWYDNGGKVTHNYLKHIRKNLREEIFQFLRSLPLNIDVSVNGTQYKLVHGAPVDLYRDYRSRYSTAEEFAVWKRLRKDQKIDTDYTIVFGHTPTSAYQDTWPLKIWKSDNLIGIDCRTYSNDGGRLACLRLDDMKEFYSDEPAYYIFSKVTQIEGRSKQHYYSCIGKKCCILHLRVGEYGLVKLAGDAFYEGYKLALPRVECIDIADQQGSLIITTENNAFYLTKV